jgi:hypothetical protein
MGKTTGGRRIDSNRHVEGSRRTTEITCEKGCNRFLCSLSVVLKGVYRQFVREGARALLAAQPCRDARDVHGRRPDLGRGADARLRREHPNLYAVLSRGELRQGSGPWWEPGRSGLVYNPPNVVLRSRMFSASTGRANGVARHSREASSHPPRRQFDDAASGR